MTCRLLHPFDRGPRGAAQPKCPHLNAANCADNGLTPRTEYHHPAAVYVGGLNTRTTPAAGRLPWYCIKSTPKRATAIERERIRWCWSAHPDMMMASHAGTARTSPACMITGSTIVPARIIVPYTRAACRWCRSTAHRNPSHRRPPEGRGRRAQSRAHCELRIVDDFGRDVRKARPAKSRCAAQMWRAGSTRATYASGCRGLSVRGRRRKEMIISGGENIYPAEIENLLAECRTSPRLLSSAVPTSAGRVVVAVAPKLDTACRHRCCNCSMGRIARYKHPKEVALSARCRKPLGQGSKRGPAPDARARERQVKCIKPHAVLFCP